MRWSSSSCCTARGRDSGTSASRRPECRVHPAAHGVLEPLVHHVRRESAFLPADHLGRQEVLRDGLCMYFLVPRWIFSVASSRTAYSTTVRSGTAPALPGCAPLTSCRRTSTVRRGATTGVRATGKPSTRRPAPQLLQLPSNRGSCRQAPGRADRLEQTVNHVSGQDRKHILISPEPVGRIERVEAALQRLVAPQRRSHRPHHGAQRPPGCAPKSRNELPGVACSRQTTRRAPGRSVRPSHHVARARRRRTSGRWTTSRPAPRDWSRPSTAIARSCPA